MHLDRQHPMPVYLQLKEMLQNQIEQGVYSPHQKLPSERDLCEQYKLSRMTARRALKELIDGGLAYTRVGKGTFVNNNVNGRSRSSISEIDGSFTLAYEFTGRECQQKLTTQLLEFDSVGIERTISKALATYSLEVVALELFPQLIRQFEQQWHNEEIDLLTQRYATTTLHIQLIGMLNATSPLASGPRVVLACAPGDLHEIGLLLLALGLRRRGFVVTYLGSDTTMTEFPKLIEMVQPQLICFSAATVQAVQVLAAFSQECHINSSIRTSGAIGDPQIPLLTFGGVAFTQHPELISEMDGLYLGDTVETAVFNVQQLVEFE